MEIAQKYGTHIALSKTGGVIIALGNKLSLSICPWFDAPVAVRVRAAG